MYIHSATCISPQLTFPETHLEQLQISVENKLFAKEPKYEGIPLGVLRRMGRAVRFGVGSAMPLLNASDKIDGIIVGTGNGGMEDCIKFLNQIIQYDEGTLTPTNFVQSTPNAIAAQLGLMSKNTGYNITHVHRGLAFENALLDVKMLLNEHPENIYLLGGIDEISDYNYNIEYLGDWYKHEEISNRNLYEIDTHGSMAGEGAAMFVVNNDSKNAIAFVRELVMLHTEDIMEVQGHLNAILNKFPDKKVDLLLSGENGDIRFKPYYNAMESLVPGTTGIARFKHMTGEYPSVSSTALWLACELLKNDSVPEHMIKAPIQNESLNNILVYNNYKGLQHSFMLVSGI